MDSKYYTAKRMSSMFSLTSSTINYRLRRLGIKPVIKKGKVCFFSHDQMIEVKSYMDIAVSKIKPLRPIDNWNGIPNVIYVSQIIMVFESKLNYMI